MKTWKSALIAIGIATFTATAVAAPSAQDLFHEGQAAYDTGDYATAIAEYQRILDRNPNRLSARLQLARALRAIGKVAEAMDTKMFYGGLTYSSHPVSLAAALATVAARRAEFSSAARRRAVEHFDLQPWLLRHREIFNRVLAV